MAARLEDKKSMSLTRRAERQVKSLLPWFWIKIQVKTDLKSHRYSLQSCHLWNSPVNTSRQTEAVSCSLLMRPGSWFLLHQPQSSQGQDLNHNPPITAQTLEPHGRGRQRLLLISALVLQSQSRVTDHRCECQCWEGLQVHHDPKRLKVK